MGPRFPFFGILSVNSPIEGLIEHYELISKGTMMLEQALTCYLEEGPSPKFTELQEDVEQAEDHADAIERNLRNHLPRGLFMAVDKTLFLSYLGRQDNILDAGQESLDWLSMRKVDIPQHFRKGLIEFILEITKNVTLLEPALRSTVQLLDGDETDRDHTKLIYRNVRQQHRHVNSRSHALTAEIYNSDMDFKDIYQLIHFVERLHNMSHNTENCADILRAMIAK